MKQDPKVGGVVWMPGLQTRGEIIGIGSISSKRAPEGIEPCYNVKFIDGPLPGGVNCLRDEFVFPLPGEEPPFQQYT
jgi:hypothetical protein